MMGVNIMGQEMLILSQHLVFCQGLGLTFHHYLLLLITIKYFIYYNIYLKIFKWTSLCPYFLKHKDQAPYIEMNDGHSKGLTLLFWENTDQKGLLKKSLKGIL
jgi:hypothetical protein